MNVVRVVARGWLMHLKMLSRSWFNGVLGVVWPLFFSTTTFLMYGAGDDTGLVSTAVGACVMGVWSSTGTSGAGALQRERWQGTLELLAASPAPFAATVLPITLAMSTIGLYSMTATALWGWLLFDISLPVAEPFALAVAVLVTVVAIGIFGFLLAVCVVRYRSAWALGNMLEFPIWLICGFVVPLSLLPSWVQPIAWLLPPTWGVRAIKEAALGGSPYVSIALAAGLGAVYCVAGSLLARRMLHSARATGTLALS